MAIHYVANPAPSTSRLTLKGAGKTMAQKKASTRSSTASHSSSPRKHSRRKSNPATGAAATGLVANGRRSGRRRRRNPVRVGAFGILTGGAIGAAGSIGIEYLLRMLPTPASPIAQAGVQGGIALGLHSFGKHMPGGQETADTIALIIAAFAIRNLVLQFVPALGRTPIHLGVAQGAGAVAVAGDGMSDYAYLPDANLNDYVYVEDADAN